MTYIFDKAAILLTGFLLELEFKVGLKGTPKIVATVLTSEKVKKSVGSKVMDCLLLFYFLITQTPLLICT